MQPGMSICCVVYSGGISDKEMKWKQHVQPL
jgi:hypothetical protein